MRWTAQALHIARKDLTAVKWFFVAYVLLLAITLTQIVVSPVLLFSFWPLFVLLASMLTMAIVVQLDSPWAVNAFWATRPFDASAVFGGKVAFAAIVLVGAALIAETIALVAHAVPAAEFALMLAEGAMGLFAALIFVSVLAAVTQDLRAFLLVEFGILIVQNTLGMMIYFRISESGYRLPTWFSAIGSVAILAAGLLLVLHQYKTRFRRVRLVVALLVGNFLLGVFTVRPESPNKPRNRSRTTAPQGLLEAWRSPGIFASWDASLTVRLTGTDSRYAYVFYPTAYLRERYDGETRIGRMPNILNLQNAQPPAIEGATWRERESDVPVARGTTLRLSHSEFSEYNRLDATVKLKGYIEVFEPYAAARAPLVKGNWLISAGERISIVDVREDREDAINVGISRVSRVPEIDQLSLGFARADFALLNTSTNEVASLSPGGGSSGPGTILPHRGSYRKMQGLRTASPRDTVPRWPLGRGEGVDLIRIRWRSLGSYPVDVAVTRAPPADFVARFERAR